MPLPAIFKAPQISSEDILHCTVIGHWYVFNNYQALLAFWIHTWVATMDHKSQLMKFEEGHQHSLFVVHHSAFIIYFIDMCLQYFMYVILYLGISMSPQHTEMKFDCNL